MQILCTSLNDANVFSVHAGQNIGIVKSWLIDLKDLKISMLQVELPDSKKFYLLAEDIRSLGISGKPLVIIDSEDKLSEKEDLLRHQEMISANISLIGHKVRTQSGTNVGRVKDLSIDINDMYIKKIHVKAKGIQALINERLLVDRADIVEINDKTLVIKDAYSKTKQTAHKALPA